MASFPNFLTVRATAPFAETLTALTTMVFLPFLIVTVALPVTGLVAETLPVTLTLAAFLATLTLRTVVLDATLPAGGGLATVTADDVEVTVASPALVAVDL